MKRKIIAVFSVVVVAFALTAGIGAFNSVKAAPYVDGQRGFSLPAGDVNAAGVDLADNSVRVKDRDLNSATNNFAPDSYGIHNTLRP